MAKTKSTSDNSKEDIRMAKYIVEAPEPKEGQKISSGGIRENGKLVTQYKNPVPCKEKKNNIGTYLLSLAWKELGEPVLRSSLNNLGDVFIDKIHSTIDQIAWHKHSTEPKVSDVEADEIEPMYESDKVVRFSNKKAI